MDIDHIVLWVEDARRSLAFYRDIIGLPAYREDEFVRGEVFFPSVRVSAHSILDLMPRAGVPGTRQFTGERLPTGAGQAINHFCLSMRHDEFTALRARIEAAALPFKISGAQSGARGHSVDSFYVQDPDGNVIEARYYAE